MTADTQAPAPAPQAPRLLWYLGAMNDARFIIDGPPGASTDGGPFDWPEGPNAVAGSVDALAPGVAEAIVQAHNVAIHKAHQWGYKLGQSATPAPTADMVLVPREPTPEMKEAWFQACDVPVWEWADSYRAMLAASPTPSPGPADAHRALGHLYGIASSIASVGPDIASDIRHHADTIMWAMTSPSPARAGAKELVWDTLHGFEGRAETPFGWITIQLVRDGDQLRLDTPWKDNYEFFLTLEAAKTAAQADFTRRIQSCVTTPLAGGAAPSWLTNCCRCGRVVDTRERSEGGDGHGCEDSDGSWTCSSACWEAVAEGAPLAGEAGAVEALRAFARWALEPSFTGHDLEGSEVQEKAADLGLLVETVYDPEKHGPSDFGEPGMPWFVFGPALDASLTPPKAETETARSVAQDGARALSAKAMTGMREVSLPGKAVFKTAPVETASERERLVEALDQIANGVLRWPNSSVARRDATAVECRRIARAALSTETGR